MKAGFAGVLWAFLEACSLEETPTTACASDSDCLARRVCENGACQNRSAIPSEPSDGGDAGRSSTEIGGGGNDGIAGDASGTSNSSASDGGSGGNESADFGSRSGAGGSKADENGGASGSHPGESNSGAPGEVVCPESPAAVKLPAGFCMDAHEVTRGQYDTWRSLDPALWKPPGCENNATLEPSCIWVTGTDDRPANCVDWCDAAAYCRAHGARLCGAIEGGSSSFSEPNGPDSQWFNACSSAGRFGYPYGDDYDADRCNTQSTGTTDVGSRADCRASQGAYACLFDLSGNVREWEDACDGDSVTSRCRIRGGAYPLGGSDVACTAVASFSRTSASESIGFRCCSDECD